MALHVSNGDATDLAGTGLAEHVVYWRDALHEGPVPAVGPEELRRIRADFLVTAGADDRGEAARTFLERDETLAAHRDGEYVLWFEADLYDQLQIIQVLDRLRTLEVPAERITLICIGEHPGIAHFGGLGELSTDKLRDLATSNASLRLTSDALDLAARAWATFTAPTPVGLADIAATRSVALRFLGEAFDRLAREYPSTRDGLSLTERRILAASRDGPTRAGTVFTRATAREVRPFLGDTWCFAIIRRLGAAPHPLLAVEPSPDKVDRHSVVRLTDVGGQVLAAAADHVAVNGIDRWIGGVHLHGDHAEWRFDEGTETLTRH
ncbi:MAG: hypothetical protein QOF53_1340 [Nocardioidaceae bacterium]|nr:hypothetical protein [Nocardioidaceae bacterium]